MGFCTGNSGAPIFIDDFGTGETKRLPILTTTYLYAENRPNNRSYNVSTNTNWFGWHNINDHTRRDTNGRMLIVNADDSRAGEFYRTLIKGLCENTSYEFSSWIINLLPKHSDCNPAVPVNVRFEIWDSTDTKLLARGDTGNIRGSRKATWKQYALVFQTKSSQSSVILKMRNNGIGGCGNDLAIDDIMFRTCGDSVIIKDSLNNTGYVSVHKDDFPYSTILTAIPDFSVFSTHFYQWQESKDGVEWININGENSNNLSITNINNGTFYRTLVAEDPVNILNSSCNIISDFFEVKIGERTKTLKKVIIVKNGFNIIYDKVWIDGAVGRFVKTGEEIIKQGSSNTIIIEETIYSKARYGYNSVTRTYRIQK